LCMKCLIQKFASTLISGMTLKKMVQQYTHDLGVMLGSKMTLCQEYFLLKKSSRIYVIL
jgi:hypothetical protein